ncbi:CRN domain containing hypothetical protein-containing protein [Phytophthora palmivora]|uniref:Uncharacterized protein n=1 Tax=Phytophthora palmivora TaxID=4796 RepID=A0A2P4XB56_9STRA|nr:CRN domain containing hypothetical protein-containing protein [Phytophthora palmivora]
MYYAKQKLSRSSFSVIEFGNDEDNSLVVQTPQRIDSQLHYFIVPEVREHVKTSVFQLVDSAKANTDIGMGGFQLNTCVYFGKLDSYPDDRRAGNLQIVVRNIDLDCAILKSFQSK